MDHHGTATAVDPAAFIDGQAVGRPQLHVLLLCAAVLFADGFDTQAIGYVAPDVAREWGLGRGVLGPVFSAGLFGLMLGALGFSPLADQVGRRRVIVASTVAFGVLTLATVFAEGVWSLAALRFLTGLGLGGAMPNAVALTAEVSPHRRRATMVMAMFCGFSVGAALGGLLAAAVIPVWGWRGVFVIGGVAPLVLATVLLRALPESPRFLASRGRAGEAADVMARLFPRQAFAPGAVFATEVERDGTPVAALFQDGRARTTVLLWTVFFMSLLDLYFLSNWLPTVLNDLGVSLSASSAIGAMLQVGGVAGTFALGTVVDRFSFRALALTYLGAAVAIGAIGLSTHSIPLATGAIFAAGFCIVGGQIAANALGAGFYPTAARATGVGWALGVGRVGSIVGPWVGGLLLAQQWTPRGLFLVAAVPALLAALAALALALRTPAGVRGDMA